MHKITDENYQTLQEAFSIIKTILDDCQIYSDDQSRIFKSDETNACFSDEFYKTAFDNQSINKFEYDMLIALRHFKKLSEKQIENRNRLNAVILSKK